jgi:hypothetical protein
MSRRTVFVSQCKRGRTRKRQPSQQPNGFLCVLKFLDVEEVALETKLKSCHHVKPYDLYHNIGARSLCD